MRPDVEYRGVQETDFEWLLTLRRATMDPHLRAAAIEPSDAAHREAVDTDFEWTRIVRIGGDDIGMTRLVKKDLPWHLRHIQLLPEYQRRGIGQLLLEDILSEATTNSARILLNVLKVNPAHRLYSRLGFRIVEDRERAYGMEWSA